LKVKYPAAELRGILAHFDKLGFSAVLALNFISIGLYVNIGPGAWQWDWHKGWEEYHLLKFIKSQ
jgi:hypothetical protein